MPAQAGDLPVREAGAPQRVETAGVRRSPGFILLGVVIFCTFAAAATTMAALSAPWLGLRLQVLQDRIVAAQVANNSPAAAAGIPPQAQLISIGPAQPGAKGAIQLIPIDLVEDPDGLESYAVRTEFLDRQSLMAGLLDAGAVAVRIRTGENAASTVVLDPVGRPLGSLPLVYWVQLGSGLCGLLVGAWVWSMRRRDLPAQLFALTGAGLAVSALPAAIYSTRELAIHGMLFDWLTVFNHLGTHLFGGAMIALFLSYPKRLVRPASLLAVPVLLGLWLWADVTDRMPDPTTGMYLPILLEMLAIVILVLVQLRLARFEPATRAALRWLGLSVVFGAGAFVLGIAVPLLLEADTAISQGYAFAFFIIVYGGIALGIRRYRLFELGHWAYRVFFYTVGAVLLVILDAALIWFLRIESFAAMGISLFVVGFAYLPLRDSLWRRLNRRRMLPDHELFASALDVAFGVNGRERAERWRSLLSRLYDPLELLPSGQAPGAVTVDNDGLEMTVPELADSPALRLRFPFGGKGIFGPQDLSLARQLMDLVGKASTNRRAYDRGVMEERQRIARDLHDDVGARLITGIHTVDESTRPVLQAALADIRSIVSGLTGRHMSLDRVLAEARHEAARRLEAAGIALDWPLAGMQAERIEIDYRQSKAIISSVREVISNIVRHSRGRRVSAEIGFAGHRFTMTIADDGEGMDPERDTQGFGLGNMKRRIAEVGGQLSVTSDRTGTRVTMWIPLTPWPAGSGPGIAGGTRTAMP